MTRRFCPERMTLYTTFDTDGGQDVATAPLPIPRPLAYTRPSTPRVAPQTMRQRLAANEEQANLLATIYEIGGMAVVG